MSRERVDALFFSYWADVDRWHNDFPAGVERLSERAGGGDADTTLIGRIARQAVRIDGRPHDFARFQSLVRYDTTAEWRRWDAYTPTHLSGSFFESLLGRRGFDLRHVNYADRVVVKELSERFAPRWVLFSTTFLIEVPTIMDAIQRLRRAFPDAGVVVGGFMLSEFERDVDGATFQRFLRAWGADAYVVSVQAEEVLTRILSADPADLRSLDLPSTLVRQPDGSYAPASTAPEPGLSMDDSWVRWSELDPSTLYHTVHVRTARSCTFKCAFCSLFNIEGTLANATPDTLRAELEELARVGHVRSIIFTDDTFNVPQRRFKELLRVLCDFEFEWYSFYRCQFADDETGELMKASGCRGVFLGLESVDDEVLKRMNKATTLRSYERGLEQLKKHDIRVHGNFIIGFPGDTPDHARRIVEFVDDWDLDFYSVSPWFCAPSTDATNADYRERYSIEGVYYNWKHETMTSEEAIDLEQWMIRQPKRAVYMSQLSASTFWSEILMYANGFDRDEVRTAARTFNGFAGRDTPAEAVLASPEVRALREVLRRREMAPPAGREVLGPTGAPVP